MGGFLLLFQIEICIVCCKILAMRQLNDTDIENMIAGDFSPDDASTRRAVRTQLHLSQRIPSQPRVPECVVLDLHMRTEQQAWDAIMQIAQSGTRRAKIITGASGILKVKFQQWATDSLMSPYIVSVTPINNGSFDVKFKKRPPHN